MIQVTGSDVDRYSGTKMIIDPAASIKVSPCDQTVPHFFLLEAKHMVILNH